MTGARRSVEQLSWLAVGALKPRDVGAASVTVRQSAVTPRCRPVGRQRCDNSISVSFRRRRDRPMAVRRRPASASAVGEL